MEKICKVTERSKNNEQSVTTSKGTYKVDMSEVDKLPTKSSKIRYLFSQTGDRSAVALLLGIRYQHVRNVLTQELKKS